MKLPLAAIWKKYKLVLLVAAVGLCTIVVFKTDKWVQYAND